jgi:hypothetical protein
MNIEVSNPMAMLKAMMNPFNPRINPLCKLPSIKSENELISGTPGIKNKTDVANACSWVCSTSSLYASPTINVEVRAAK